MGDLTARLAALLAEHAFMRWEYRPGRWVCRCGHWGFVNTNPADGHLYHVAAVLAENGVGFVAEGEYVRLETAEKYRADAERAEAALTVTEQFKEHYHEQWMLTEAALADLRARVRALADLRADIATLIREQACHEDKDASCPCFDFHCMAEMVENFRS